MSCPENINASDTTVTHNMCLTKLAEPNFEDDYLYRSFRRRASSSSTTNQPKEQKDEEDEEERQLRENRRRPRSHSSKNNRPMERGSSPFPSAEMHQALQDLGERRSKLVSHLNQEVRALKREMKYIDLEKEESKGKTEALSMSPSCNQVNKQEHERKLLEQRLEVS